MATYNISTLVQLQAMASHLGDDCVLLNDIDATATRTDTTTYPNGFVPVGDEAVAAFTGSFDGQGFTISNLYINATNNNACGLFGRAEIGTKTVKNVTLSNISITKSGGNGIGGLFGQLLGTDGSNRATVSGCHVYGTISGSSSVGGMVGDSINANFTSCTTNVVLSSNPQWQKAGGFCGNNTASNHTSCSSSGSINSTITTENSVYVGGYVGYATNAATSAGVSTFTSCSSSTAILSNFTDNGGGATSSLGGFVGHGYVNGSNESVFTLCGSSSSVTEIGTIAHRIGGFAAIGNASITKCRASGNVSCPNATTGFTASYIGGFAGSMSGAISNCYASGSVCEDGLSNAAALLGGFCGITATNVTNCYSRGYVNPDGVSGGFAGTFGAGTRTSCYWDTETSGMTAGAGSGSVTGVSGKTTAQMQLIATFTGWDFTTIWEMMTFSQAAIAASNLTVWMSTTGDYDKFEEGVKDDDSFQLTIPSTNEIRWIDSQECLVLGTAADEWKLASNKLETPLSPTNFGVKRQSGHGSAYIQSIQVNEVILFIDYVSRKLREMSFSQDIYKYTCPDMTALAEHITSGKIKWIAYQKNPDSILWVGLQNGKVRGFVYDREQNVTAWFKVPFQDGVEVQGGCVIPGETEDSLYLAVGREIPGSVLTYGGEAVTYGTAGLVYGSRTVVYIEKMMPRVFGDIEDSFFVDSGVTATNVTAFSTVDVAHLEGETVKVLGDGVVFDDATVDDGQITLQLNGVTTTVNTAQVGLAFTSKIQPMRIVLGDSIGSITRINELVVSLLETGYAKYGISDSDLKVVNLSDIRWTNTADISGLFTGEVVLSMQGGFDPLNPVIISSDSPLPLTVRCMIPRIDRTGR
jgi:hypothetical protein